MKKCRKLLTCLFALTLAFSAAGCGSSKEQEATAEAAETGTDASETIGSGADMNTELDTENATSLETSPSLADGLIITVTKMEVEIDQNRMYVNVENTTENDIYIEWTNLIMNGKDVSNPNAWFEDWSPSEWTPCVKANDIYQEVFTIEHPSSPGHTIFNMADFEATVSSSDKSSSERFTAYFLLSDVETIKISETGEKTVVGDTAPEGETVIHIEEQELYNTDNLIVTVPEQTLKIFYYDNGRLYQDVKLHFECNYEYNPDVSFTQIKINGQMAYCAGFTSLESGKTTEYLLPLGDYVDSSETSGEIAFLMRISNPEEDIDVNEVEITIPFTVTEE